VDLISIDTSGVFLLDSLDTTLELLRRRSYLTRKPPVILISIRSATTVEEIKKYYPTKYKEMLRERLDKLRTVYHYRLQKREDNSGVSLEALMAQVSAICDHRTVRIIAHP